MHLEVLLIKDIDQMSNDTTDMLHKCMCMYACIYVFMYVFYVCMYIYMNVSMYP